LIDNKGRFFIFNSKVEAAQKLEQIRAGMGNAVYEVIRIIDGVPLFLEDHYIRLTGSLSLLGFGVSITVDGLREQIDTLVCANEEHNCNIKIIVYAGHPSNQYLLYVSSSYYPTCEEIEKGVKVSLFEWERNSPNIKLLNKNYKDEVGKYMQDTGSFEALLVNTEGKITEGSRSNAFFVKGCKVYTAPGEYVLKGVTRKYVIDTCMKLGMEVVETLADIHLLDKFEGLFISGTSIKVLPVYDVGGHQYKSGTHPSIVSVRDQFNKLIDDYIMEHR